MSISMIKGMPEDLARNLLRDELHSALVAMGVPLEKIRASDIDLYHEISKYRAMPEAEAFQRIVGEVKGYLLGLGVEKSILDGLLFE